MLACLDKRGSGNFSPERIDPQNIKPPGFLFRQVFCPGGGFRLGWDKIFVGGSKLFEVHCTQTTKHQIVVLPPRFLKNAQFRGGFLVEDYRPKYPPKKFVFALNGPLGRITLGREALDSVAKSNLPEQGCASGGWAEPIGTI